MNSKLSLSLFAAAAVAGLAFAGASSPQDPVRRLEALEKEVASLKSELASVKQAHDGEMAKALEQQRGEIDTLLAWARAQAQAGTTLQGVLAESRDKGFTAGINPDSRVVLLDGVHAFADSLKAGLPEEPPAPEAPKRPLPPARKQKQK